MRIVSFPLIMICSVLFLGSCKKKIGGADEAKKDTTTTMYYEFHDFESVADGRIDNTKGLSGKNAAVVNDKIEYGFGLAKQFNQISSYKNIDEVNIAFNCWMSKKCPDDVFVLSIDDTVSKKNVYWEGKGIVPAKYNEWSPISINFKLKKDFLQPDYFVKLYIWNKGKDTIYFDDLSYDFVQLKK